jgi:hypothetical protein
VAEAAARARESSVPAPQGPTTTAGLAAPADWVRFPQAQNVGWQASPFAISTHATRQTDFPDAPTPALRPSEPTPPARRMDYRPTEPLAAPERDGAPRSVVESPPPEKAGLLSAGSAFALAALESTLDALTDHVAPEADRSSLPCWLGLAGWGMGAALAWLAMRREQQTEEERLIALTQEKP